VYAYHFIGGFSEQQGSGGGIRPSAQCHSDLSFSHAARFFAESTLSGIGFFAALRMTGSEGLGMTHWLLLDIFWIFPLHFVQSENDKNG
jgi:hypothetical protein